MPAAVNTKKPVMLMLHGAGSSGDIFKIQTHFLSKDLSKQYEMVYIDAPTQGPPGPGVLPLFAEMPAYYHWLSLEAGTHHLEQLISIAHHIEDSLSAKGYSNEDVEAIMGFSQGGMVALSMQGLKLAAQSPWENLRFTVVIGAGTSGNTKMMDGVESMVAGVASLTGCDDDKFPGFTVHAAGVKDVWYKDSRRLATFCTEDRTEVIDYREGHVVPRKKLDVTKLLNAIKEIDEASKESPVLDAQQTSELLENLPLLMQADNVREGIDMLNAQGVMV